MKTLRVKDLMIPLKDYATIKNEDTLADAVQTLEEAQNTYLSASSDRRYPHRGVVVVNVAGQVVGKLSMLDVLQCLEPKYETIFASRAVNRTSISGLSPSFLKTMLSNYGLFDRPLSDLCRKAAKIKVKDCMATPESGEIVHLEDTLEVAVHQLIVGQHQSLLVMHEKQIVGILRLVDVFHQVGRRIASCSLP